jgi:ankyrin repeat protein
VSSLSINSLTYPIGLRFPRLSDPTRDACRQVAERALRLLSYVGAYLGYKIGSVRLLNAVFVLKFGISLEKTLLNELHLAALFGTAADVKSALAKRENLSAKDCKGNTPLHVAVDTGNIEVMDALLQAGADINAKDSNGDTPLHQAVLRKNKQMVRSLISKGADIHAINSKGQSPLALFYSRQTDNSSTTYAQQLYGSCAALYNKTRNTCERVIDESRWETSRLVSAFAYKIGSTRITNAQCERNLGISLEKTLMTALHLAAAYGTVADIKAALAKGENVNAKDFRGHTPLHLAVIYANKEVVKELIVNGAQVNAKNLKGNTPLQYGVLENNKEVVRTLVAHGADIHAHNTNGISPAERASGRPGILSILHNAESHPAFASSKTAFHAYFDKMFPPCRDALPKDLKWLETMKKKLDEGKDPFDELRSIFAKFGPISFKMNVKLLQDLQSKQALESKSLSAPSSDMIRDCLIQNSPLFSKVWEAANRHEKWTLHEEDLISQKKSLAYMAYFQHKIYLEKSDHIFDKAYNIIFETLNAFQNKRYLTIEKLAEAGMLSREEYSLLIEYLEDETLQWTHRIIGWKEPSSFADSWKATNKPRRMGSAPYDQIHTDTYRKQWDLFYGFTYLKKHPEFIHSD